METCRTKLNENKYSRRTRMLDATPDHSQREMAKVLGFSFDGINYCSNALIDKGLVKIRHFSQNQNKFGYAQLLPPSGIAELASLTSNLLRRKINGYEALMAEIETLKSEIDIKNGEKPC